METPVEVLVSETWIPARMSMLNDQQGHPYCGCAIVFMSYDAYKAAKGESTQPSCGWLLDQRPTEQIEGEIKCAVKPGFWRFVGAEKTEALKNAESAPARKDWSPEVSRRELERGADGRLPKWMR